MFGLGASKASESMCRRSLIAPLNV